MKRILFIALMLASFASFAQPQFGGQVGGYDNSGTKKFLMFNGNAGKFWDSTANVYNLAMKLKTDSIFSKMDSTFQRSTLKISQLPAINITNTSFGISGTLPGFASTPTVNIGTTGTIPVSGTFWQATQPVSLASVPSHPVTNAGTFAVQSTNQANSGVDIGDVTINNASGASAVNIQDGGNSITVDGSITNISGTISLPTGASTSALQTSGNTLLQKIRTADSTIDLTTDAILSSVQVIEATASNIQTSVDNISTWADNNVLARKTDSTQTPFDGYNVYGQVRTNAPSLTDGKSGLLSLTDKGGLRVTLTDLAGAYVAAGGGGGGGGGLSTFTSYDTVGSSTSMTVTNLNSLANSATVGWQSDTVINRTRQATDYRIFVKATMSNTAPANDKQIYLYIAPFYYDGTSYLGPSLGTTSQATGVQGACTIASAAPNNLILLGVLSYSTQNMVLQSTFSLSSIFGKSLPDAWSLVLINYTGSNISASGNNVYFKPVYVTNR